MIIDPKYKRIMLKLSGEVLAGERGFGVDGATVKKICAVIAECVQNGVQTGVVVGGGNIFRGISASAAGMDRVAADHMGMLATVINSLSLKDALEKIGIPTRVQTAIEMRQIAEPFIRLRAMRHMEKERVIIFAAGTGNPYFSTDTAATLRASEINAEVVIKATKVNGIYTSDPKEDSSAKKFDKISYMEVLTKGLKVMDSTAISMCMDNRIPIIVFDLYEKGSLLKIVKGEPVGTLVE